MSPKSIVWFVSKYRILRKIDPYLSKETHLQVNIRIQVWILQFKIFLIESYDSSRLSEQE